MYSCTSIIFTCDDNELLMTINFYVLCLCCVAYIELPDGKVLSGSEWGNMLLWDGGFIKVELSKKGKKFCHNVRKTINSY